MIAALLLLSAQAPAVERVQLDAVAAVVDRKVITVSEVKAEARLALLEKVGVLAADGPTDSRFLKAVLDHVVVQELLLVESRRSQTGVVKEGAVEARVQALRALCGTPEDATRFFARYAIDDELLRARARRDLMDQALVSEVMARAGVPSDDEVKRSLAGASVSPERVAAAREELLRARRDAAFKALMERLRSELDVRVVASFDDTTVGRDEQ